MLAYLQYPSWLKPEVFAGVHFPSFLGFLNIIRWYGVMYIVGLALFLILARYLIHTEKAQLRTFNSQLLDDIFFAGVIGLILGGRIFYCLVYDLPYFARHPLEIIIPFDMNTHRFTGFSGMSYHGAVIGIFLACAIFATVKRLDWREVTDIIFPAAPLGYAFGRLGNFINAELYGRITASPVGMIFPNAEKLPINLPDVQRVLHQLGWQVNEATGTVTTAAGTALHDLIGGIIINNTAVLAINLPRHPSQLYEFFFEGIFLFVIMWFIFRKHKPFDGFMGSAYLGGYALVRFFIEFFRQPDYQFANYETGKYVGTIAGGLSMGQILCIIMFGCAIAYGVFLQYFYKPTNLAYLEHKIK